MRVLGQPAIVLHATRWRESSLLVEMFTHEHGRIGMVARGVQGAKKQPLRAALQPLQRIRVDYLHRGELAQLLHAEAGGHAPPLAGDALLAGFYVAELVLRLLQRDDAHPELFLRFAHALDELAETTSLSWTLRRFERDLLEGLGYALDLSHDANATPLEADARYRIDPEHGALRVRDGGAVDRGGIGGAALLALADETVPSDAQLREQRVALRTLIAHHLGPRGLRSWGLLAEFAGLKRIDAGSDAAQDRD
ncbi:MAG TPA: DNA repair protein RecO [Xanthomonadaceae bacterium]|nr:DNA repair protein RecO [Xanthomonadaceae bacterium]